jgi:NodT family efflux transporter outer membrane factor (OMF) lipoprotein
MNPSTRMNTDEHGEGKSSMNNRGHGCSVASSIRASSFLCSSAFICVPLLFLGGCAIGPNYSKPAIEAPAQWKEAGDWVVAQPKDAAPKGKWWEAFNDPVLNGLEEQVQVSNQTLAAAEARYRQARAAVQSARAGFFPTLSGSADATRSGGGGNSGSGINSSTGTTGTTTNFGNSVGNRYSVGLDARWEIDLWGRIRRLVEAARAGEQASAADLEAAKLSIQAEIATDYFQLRVTDVTRDLLDDTVKAFQTSLDVTRNRYRAGVAGRVDIVQAEAQLLSTQAQAIDLRVTRATLEHAIATLVGKAPASFSLAQAKLDSMIPDVPPAVPSTLLERRPDIGAAERRVAAANAQIGVAEAAYFPALTLSGSGSYASSTVAHIFSAPNRVWSLGADLADTILDFGVRSAAVATARGVYDELAADYRQTVLTAFQDVEDNLATVHWLAEESKVEQEAVRAARESTALTVNQYKAGTVSFLNVVQVQATQLNEERTSVTLLGRRLAATVGLIRAMGGTWQ